MINQTQLKQLYFEMLRIRMIEERVAELYTEQEMRCPVHLCIGQEAIAVGVCANLKKEDYVMSGHRSHGHYLAKGGDLKAMMAELYGKATGCSSGKGGSMHLVDLSVGFLGATPIVGSTIAIATGAALGIQMKKEKRVAVIFFGEGATEEGVFHESANFAMLKKLPIVFVCENNLYSVYSPMKVRQPKDREVFELAKGHGMESRQGNGNNVAEVYRLAKKAILKARSGQGPTFLEFSTYRWREHCGPNYDNQLGYRTEAEYKRWKRLCPIENLEKQFVKKHVLKSGEIQQMKEDLDKEISTAAQFAKKSPFPHDGALEREVYAE